MFALDRLAVAERRGFRQTRSWPYGS